MNTTTQIYSWLKSSKAIVITTGAGMGVDSGLADYRGNDGRWGKVKDQTKLNAMEVSNPKYLAENPRYVWTMFIERMLEYKNTIPHKGFDILLKWIKKFKLDYFVLTSNVDEQFLKAGFDNQKYRELHGSIFYMQCSKPCTNKIWRYNFDLDKTKKQIENNSFPQCPNCGSLIRPNIYMFRDNTYISNRSDKQNERYQNFLQIQKNNELIVFEIGSGPHVQSIRQKTRQLGIYFNSHIVRINPKDAKIKPPHIGIAKGALTTLTEIDDFLQ